MKTRSKKGVLVDFGALMAKSGSTIAVGNAKMNARGDVLAHGGIVEQTAEAAAHAYYQNNPRAVTHTVALHQLDDEILSPAEALRALGVELPAPPKVRRKTSDE